MAEVYLIFSSLFHYFFVQEGKSYPAVHRVGAAQVSGPNPGQRGEQHDAGHEGGHAVQGLHVVLHLVLAQRGHSFRGRRRRRRPCRPCPSYHLFSREGGQQQLRRTIIHRAPHDPTPRESTAAFNV